MTIELPHRWTVGINVKSKGVTLYCDSHFSDLNYKIKSFKYIYIKK